jgi:hypothetical protein
LQGYWSYHGGHDTPPAPAIMRVMKAAGARAVVHVPHDAESRRLFEEWGWREGGWARAVSAPVRAWGDREPTAAEIADFKAAAIANIRKAQGDAPEVVTLFAEPSISRDLTTGSPPEYWGETRAHGGRAAVAGGVHAHVAGGRRGRAGNVAEGEGAHSVG